MIDHVADGLDLTRPASVTEAKLMSLYAGDGDKVNPSPEELASTSRYSEAASYMQGMKHG